MVTKENLQKQAKAQLEKWDAQISELQAKADQASAETKLQYQQQLQTLQEKRQQAQQKLEDLKAASGDALQEAQTGLESVIGDVQSTFDNIVSKFK